MGGSLSVPHTSASPARFTVTHPAPELGGRTASKTGPPYNPGVQKDVRAIGPGPLPAAEGQESLGGNQVPLCFLGKGQLPGNGPHSLEQRWSPGEGWDAVCFRVCF